ncbi:MAG: terminase gpA endonuclease subunit [Terrimicrobiaceae bacterium]
MRHPAFDEIGEQLARIWDPKRRPSPLEWAEENVYLDKRFSPRPGRYDCTYTPYMRQLHEWFGDPRIRQISLAKGAQIAGTTWLANCIMWAIVEDPGPILYVTSTGDNAKSWSERELIPRLKSCDAIKPLLPDNDDDFRKSEMHFSTCTLRLTGSNSEGNLASRPIRYLFADEVDKWPDQSTTEAPALELAMARTNFYRKISKVCLASTPTVEAGAIWQQFLLGSQHYYHLPCPDCGHLQPLVFEQVKWPEHHRDLAEGWDLDGVAREATYQCISCKSHWPQSRQAELCRKGEWIATNPRAVSDHISAHISSLYSPQLSWGDLARLFLQKKSSPGGMHDFYNNFLGLPWENRAAQVKEDAVLQLRDPSYTVGQLPIDPVIITLCADPGQTETHWTAEARLSTGESYVIDYGTVLAIEDLLSDEFLAARKYSFGETTHSPRFGLIDSGYNTERVYALCARSGGLFMPSKGSTASFGTWTQSTVNAYPSLRLVTYVDYTAKTELYLERINKKLPPLLHFPSDSSKEFIDGHTGQQLLQNKNSRLAPHYWKKVVSDHYGDCSKLHAVAWWVLK